MPNVKDRTLNLETSLRILGAVESAVGRALGISRIGDDSFPYIPLDCTKFFKLMSKELEGRDVEKVKYLEIGSGIGTKLYIAYNCFGIKSVDGIEINSKYAEISKQFYFVKVFEQDAHAFSKYKNYDIIYTYQPVMGSYNKLLQTVKKQMKKGAVLLAVDACDKITRWVKE